MGLGLGGCPPPEMVFQEQGGWGLTGHDNHVLGMVCVWGRGPGSLFLSGWRELSGSEHHHDPALVSFCSLPGPHLPFLTQERTVGVTFALINHGAICSCLLSFDVTLQLARTGWKWHLVVCGTLGASCLPCSVLLETSLTRCEHSNGDYIMT